MPEDKTQDSTQEATDNGTGLPQPTYSESSGGQQSSEVSAEAIAKQVLESLNPQLDDLVSKKVQGVKDTRIDRMEKTYGELSNLEQALADVKAGGDPDQILQVYKQQELIERLNRLEQSASSTPSVGKTDEEEAFEEAVGLLSEVGLTSDPEVIELMGREHKNPTSMLMEVNRVILKRQTKPTAPAAAAIAPANSGTATTGKVDVAALQAEYEQLRLDPNWDRVLEDGKTKAGERMQEISRLIQSAG